MKAPELSIRKPLEHTHLTVTCNVTREFRFRLWLGKGLLFLAAKVLGAGIDFK